MSRATSKQLGVAVFVIFVGCLGIRADAANAFVPVSANLPTRLGSAGIEERLVRIAHSELASVREEAASWGAAHLLLNVHAELELGVAVERTSPTRWGYSLSGRIDDPTVGFVTLVVHDEAVAGAIWTPDASYEIVHLGSGVHTVREVADNVHQCGGAVSAAEAPPTVWSEKTPASDEDAVVDVLFIWTPQREEKSGGPEAVRAEIELAVAYTNDAFERSGAFVSLNLVGAEPAPDYEKPEVGEDGLSEDGSPESLVEVLRLADPSDGHMDAVHRWRDDLGADLVSLALDRGGARAILGGAFSVAGRYPGPVAHEFGHNFGLRHERSQWRTYPRHYEHGYATLRGSRCSRTIMAYGTLCGRAVRQRVSIDNIPLFSSPALFHPADGARLGMSRLSDRRGADGPADAVLHLNRARDTIAGFKPRRSSRSD